MRHLIAILLFIGFIGGAIVVSFNVNCERAQTKEKIQMEVLMFYLKQLGPKHPDTMKNVVEYTRLRNYRIDACSILGDGTNPNLFKDAR